MKKSDLAYVSAYWPKARVKLDQYAREWASMHVEACEATVVRREQSDSLMDLQLACLRRAGDRFKANLRLLEEGKRDALTNMPRLLENLPPLRPCADTNLLLEDGRPPDESTQRLAVEAVEAQLAETEALRDAGRYEEALTRTKTIAGAAQEIEWPALHAEIAFLIGTLAKWTDDEDIEERAFTRSLRLALEARSEQLALNAAASLAYELATKPGREVETITVSEVAYGLAGNLPDSVDNVTKAQLARAKALWFLGRRDESLEVAKEARSIAIRDAGPKSPAAVRAYSEYGRLLSRSGNDTAAVAEIRKALQIRESEVGEAHPSLITVISPLVTVLDAKGDWDEARVLIERARTILDTTYENRNKEREKFDFLLGISLYRSGEFAEAEPVLRDALAARTTRLGAEHPDVAIIRNALGAVLVNTTRFDEALAEYDECLEIMKKTYGPISEETAMIEEGIGVTLIDAGRFEEAELHSRRAVAILGEVVDEKHPKFAGSAGNLAIALLGQDKHQEAIELLESALATLTQIDRKAPRGGGVFV